jgi:hypothetical protein
LIIHVQQDGDGVGKIDWHACAMRRLCS